MVTLHDVARKAGVTAATVSNVIRHKGAVGEATRLRVLSAIEELGYRPNLMARGLVEGRSSTLALIVGDITNPFYAEMAVELERSARERDYSLLIANSFGLDKLLGGWVDGLITVPALTDKEVLTVAQRGLPVVLCNWAELGTLPELPTVDIDFHVGGYLAGQHLTALGHRRVAAIISGAVVGRPIAHLTRLEGFRRALEEASLELPEAYLKLGRATIESGYVAARELLALPDRPSAIFASNDLMAIGALEAAKDMGLRVPDELSIIGLDDIALSAHVRPSLTTIALSKEPFAEAVMTSLFSQLERRELTEPRVWVDPFLIERQSTAPPQNIVTGMSTPALEVGAIESEA